VIQVRSGTIRLHLIDKGPVDRSVRQVIVPPAQSQGARIGLVSSHVVVWISICRPSPSEVTKPRIPIPAQNFLEQPVMMWRDASISL